MLPTMDELTTERLLLRGWHDADLAPWAEMNADPQVREHLGDVLTRAQSDASVARFRREYDERGFGWWAVEELASGRFIGFAGLDVVDAGLPVAGVEIGWRLARAAWGRGYATEAARAVLAFAFENLGLAEVVAITTTGNLRSQAVMRRLGMIHDPAVDVADASIPDGPLRPDVLFRIRRPEATS